MKFKKGQQLKFKDRQNNIIDITIIKAIDLTGKCLFDPLFYDIKINSTNNIIKISEKSLMKYLK
jgi:hypothetical protein